MLYVFMNICMFFSHFRSAIHSVQIVSLMISIIQDSEWSSALPRWDLSIKERSWPSIIITSCPLHLYGKLYFYYKKLCWTELCFVPFGSIRTSKISSINLGIKSYGLVTKSESAIYQTGKRPYHSKIQKDIVSHHLKILLQQHPPITYQFQDLLHQIHLRLTHQVYDRLMTSIRL